LAAVLDFSLPGFLIREYWRLFEEFEQRKSWGEMAESDLWHELCFCILSSNVPFDMAKSAFLQLLTKSLLDLPLTGSGTERKIAAELSRPIYLPRRKDGSLRRYRFPVLRAKNIAGAWNFIYGSSATIAKILQSFSSGEKARDFLASTVPGLGLKESSHFLRNIKFCDSLAIIDTHVISFLNKSALLGKDSILSLTPRRYMELEQIMRAVAEKSSLSLSVLDMAIWQCARSRR
jgi:N-glycosylase/DNA lyase